MSALAQPAIYREQILAELRGNILPFWIAHAVDMKNGGFYGAVTEDLQVQNDVPRSAVLCARILWTYAAAYRIFGSGEYLAMARRAYNYLAEAFHDHEHREIYWSVDRHGQPVSDRKHVHAHGFAIYGLSEVYRATGDVDGLALAQELFHLIEAQTHDAANGGNIECCSRTWGVLADMRLSAKEPDCRKSMNTLLHLMEAYTNLLRVWNDPALRAKQAGLIHIFLNYIIDPATRHFRLFFDDTWHSLSDHVSYGHDIEGSWLMFEAAQVLGDAVVLERVRLMAVRRADVVLAKGLGAQGGILYERSPEGVDDDCHWWAQAEGLPGFYNAYQISGRSEFAEAAYRLWENILAQFVDRERGEWFRIVHRDGTPDLSQLKIGPWECPYHNSRACMEMLARLARP